MPIDERDPVIINLRSQEQAARELAASCDAKANDARTKMQDNERAASEARAKADRFHDAIEALGA
jgi:hypothetical protein